MLFRSGVCFAMGIGAFAIAQPATRSGDLERPISAIVAESESLHLPKWDDSMRDTPRADEYSVERKRVEDRWGKLAIELYARSPDDPHVGDLLTKRWVHMRNEDHLDAAMAEVDAALAKHPARALEVEIRYARAFLCFLNAETPPDAMIAAADAFIEAAGKSDPRGADVLVMAATRIGRKRADLRKAALQRAIRDYPNNVYAAMGAGKLRALEGIGKPFEFAFDDVLTGRRVDSQSLRGKIIVVQFWATWCGICVAEMPEIRALHEKYKSRGVEFIGISLDEPETTGGVAEMRHAIERYHIDWPQFYQGNGWKSDFSCGWGVDAIPRTFLIDDRGNLINARAEDDLEKQIETLLQKREAPAATQPPATP